MPSGRSRRFFVRYIARTMGKSGAGQGSQDAVKSSPIQAYSNPRSSKETNSFKSMSAPSRVEQPVRPVRSVPIIDDWKA